MTDLMHSKLITLFMLDSSTGPLSLSQISEYMLSMDYMNYFSFQEMIEALKDDGLITAESGFNRTLYQITKEGQNTLLFYRDNIETAEEDGVLSYLDSHSLEIRKQLETFSDYYKTTGGLYDANLQIRDHGEKIIDLTIKLPSEKQAQAACRQWNEHYGDVFADLMDTLIR